MLINKDNLGELDYQFRTGYNEAFAAVASMVSQLATVIPITGPSIRLTGLKAFSRMRKWLGPRHHKNLQALSLTVTPEKYEDTVDVPREDIEDDTYGQIMPAMRGLADGAIHLNHELIAGILQGSSDQLGYDGLKLAADTHAMGGTTFDNSVTTALSKTALKAAIDWFGSLTDDAGKEIALSSTHLLTRDKGSAYWMGNKLLKMEQIYEDAAWVENDLLNTLEHIKMPHITSDTFWAVLCLNQPFKPVLLVPRTSPELSSLTAINDNEQVFNLDVFSWGTRYRVTAAPGPWQLAYCSTGEG